MLQPKDILKYINAKDVDEALRIISIAYSFLIYLQPGQSLETSNATFTKLADDVLHLETEVKSMEILNELEKNGVIRLPV
jgi:hypothetical protein